VQRREVLPFVFVNPFHLHVEQRLRRDFYPGGVRNQRGEPAFVRKFHLAPLLLEFRIISEWFELPELIKIAQPIVADA
jgi:hypothetical protein